MSDSCVIEVEPAVLAESVTIHVANETMIVGEASRFRAFVCPEDAINKSILWSSSNPSVATVDAYAGVVKARRPGNAVIRATSFDGRLADEVTLTVIMDEVMILPDEGFGKVVFQSTGKTWYCINRDLIFDQETFNIIPYIERANKNYYVNPDMSDTEKSDYSVREYTDEEIRLLYAIDPYGVANYVQRFAADLDGGLEATVAYKDRIFWLLFNREPQYYARTIEGIWYEVTEWDELNDVLSESETIFGMHPIYDALTWIELLQFASTIVGIVFGTTLIGKMISTGMNIIASVHVVALATDYETVKNELSGYVFNTVSGNLIEKHFEDTLIGWAIDYVSLYDNLQDLTDAMTLDLSYSKKVINYCACDTGYNVLFEMKNGTIHRLHDVCDLINN